VLDSHPDGINPIAKRLIHSITTQDNLSTELRTNIQIVDVGVTT
jgi:hypothetical protein